MRNMEKISFVIPCYRSEPTIGTVTKEIIDIMKPLQYRYEIVLVNDGSPDNVWNVITALCAEHQNIKGINLTRNFGQPNAVMAGYSEAGGDYIITLDDDGQSPADTAPEMVSKLKENDYDVVYGVCEQAEFGAFRQLGSKLNGIMAHQLFCRPKGVRIISFSIMKRQTAQEIIKYKQPNPYMAGLVHRAAKNIGYLPVKHRGRIEGTSGYTLKKLARLWMNGLLFGLGGKNTGKQVKGTPQYIIREILNGEVHHFEDD